MLFKTTYSPELRFRDESQVNDEGYGGKEVFNSKYALC